ncbi:MAG: MscL family protein [Synechococcaceae cyanobacterium]
MLPWRDNPRQELGAVKKGQIIQIIRKQGCPRTRSFLKDFKDFINKGNVVDLAVAVVSLLIGPARLRRHPPGRRAGSAPAPIPAAEI